MAQDGQVLDGKTLREEYRIKVEGEQKAYDNTVAPVRVGDTIVGLVGVALDVTEHKRAEEALRHRTTELEASNQELDTFAHTVAHEIRNPLGTVRTAVFSVGDAIERDEMHRVERALRLAERNIVRCDAIMTELLDFTRGWALQRSSIDVDAWLNGVLDEMLDQGIIPESITCIRDLSANVEVSADTEHLRRAIVNIVNNAVDAMQECEENRNRLTASTYVVVERLEIRVCDTGCGISADVMDKLFEPLFSTKSFGVRLGLPIVKSIMEQHGGGIEINSQKDVGTTVVL